MTFGDAPMSMTFFLEWKLGLQNTPSAELFQVLSSKAVHCKNHLKKSIFLSSAVGALQEPCTEHICQVLQASLAFHLHAWMDGMIAEFF